MIKFNIVTWYSQLVAIVLFVSIFILGIYIGMRIEKNKFHSESVSPDVTDPES